MPYNLHISYAGIIQIRSKGQVDYLLSRNGSPMLFLFIFHVHYIMYTFHVQAVIEKHPERQDAVRVSITVYNAFSIYTCGMPASSNSSELTV